MPATTSAASTSTTSSLVWWGSTYNARQVDSVLGQGVGHRVKTGGRCYYRLDPDATYSDGVKVTVEDYFMMFYISLSKYVQDPYTNDYFSKEYEAITKYDDHTLVDHAEGCEARSDCSRRT